MLSLTVDPDKRYEPKWPKNKYSAYVAIPELSLFF